MSNQLSKWRRVVVVFVIAVGLIGSTVGCEPHHQAPDFTDSARIDAALQLPM